MAAQRGSPAGTHSTFRSRPCSSVISSTATGRACTWHPGKVGILEQHQCVERVAVLGERVGEEPVLRRVHRGGEEVAVEPDLACVVVVLELVARPLGDLHDHLVAVGGGVLGALGLAVGCVHAVTLPVATLGRLGPGSPVLQRSGGPSVSMPRMPDQARLRDACGERVDVGLPVVADPVAAGGLRHARRSCGRGGSRSSAGCPSTTMSSAIALAIELSTPLANEENSGSLRAPLPNSTRNASVLEPT